MAKRKEKEVEEKKETAAAVVKEAPAPPPPAAPKPATKSVKVGKLPPKNKSRLPRRQKKAKQKAAGRL